MKEHPRVFLQSSSSNKNNNSSSSSRALLMQWILNRKVLWLLFLGFVWGNVKLMWKFVQIQQQQQQQQHLLSHQVTHPQVPLQVPQTITTYTSQNQNNYSNTAATDMYVTPTTVVDHHQHAIVVPYRNRTKHLKTFLRYMGPWLDHHFPQDQFTIYIMEQDDDEMFNRAWLVNVGLSQILQTTPETNCVIVHDVDLLPNESSHVPYTWCDMPTQLASEIEHWNGTLPYDTYCGGVTSLSLKHWIQINGMSNDFVGWGGEDDDLYHRLRMNHLLIAPSSGSMNTSWPSPRHPPIGQGIFHALGKEDDPDHYQVKDHIKKDYNSNIILQMSTFMNSSRWRIDGLSDLYYNITRSRIFNNTSSNNNNNNNKSHTIHHIKAFAKDPNPPWPPLEFIHIPLSGAGQAITKAAAMSDIAWGACHFGSFPEWQCFRAPSHGNFQQHAPPYVATYSQAIRPWHRPLIEFEEPLFDTIGKDGVDRFAIVRNPYERAISFYRLVYDQKRGYPYGFQKHYSGLGDNNNMRRTVPKHVAMYLEQREDTDQMNAFLQDYLIHRFDRSFRSTAGNDLPPQAMYINPKGQQLVQHVLKYEKLKSSLDYLLPRHDLEDKLHLPIPPRRIQDTSRSPKMKHRWRPRLMVEDWRSNTLSRLYELVGWSTDTVPVTYDENAFLNAHDLTEDTITLINKIYGIDFYDFGYTKWQTNTTFLQVKSAILKTNAKRQHHQQQHPSMDNKDTAASRPIHQLEYIPIPYTVERDMTLAGSKAGVVWGACHWEKLEPLNCPAKRSGDFANSTVRFRVKNYLQAQTPWNIPLSDFYGDIYSKESKLFTVVKNPYERALDFYRQTFDRQQGHRDGFRYPTFDPEDGVPQWVIDYLIRRENAARMNGFLQKAIMSPPQLEILLPRQADYIFKPKKFSSIYALKIGSKEHFLNRLDNLKDSEEDTDSSDFVSPFDIEVLRLENLPHDFDALTKKFHWNISVELPKHVSSSSTPPPRQDRHHTDYSTTAAERRLRMPNNFKRRKKKRSSWRPTLLSTFGDTDTTTTIMDISEVESRYLLGIQDMDNTTIAILNYRYASDFQKLHYDKLATDVMYTAPPVIIENETVTKDNDYLWNGTTVEELFLYESSDFHS